MKRTVQRSGRSNETDGSVKRRTRIITGSIIGGLIVLAGVTALFQWQKLIPASSFVPAVLSEALGVWLICRTLRRNSEFARKKSSKRSIIPFGFAVFLILFGVGLVLASFKVIPDVIWSVGALLIAIGGTFIYRAVILPGDNQAD